MEMSTLETLTEMVKTYNTKEEDIKLIEKAYEYAKKYHAGEKRRTGEDFIVHPLEVAKILADSKQNVETICAALLHEVNAIENPQFEQEFGKDIASIVTGLYKINQLTFTPTSNEKVEVQRKILVGLSDDVRVILIKLASRLHNMRTLFGLPLKKQKEKALETQEIFIPIANRLGMSRIKGEMEDLCLRYLKPDVYFSIVEQLNKSKLERDSDVKKMMNQVSLLLKEAGVKHEIKGRSKSISSIYKKLDKGKKMSDIYDILALRVFVDTKEECYHALGLIHGKYKPVPKRFKDYIAMPKANMYQSLHTTVFGENEQLYEIQIRTYEMDEIAERGIASHWAYKENNANNVGKLMKNVMEQKLQFYRSIIELQKEEMTDEEFVSTVKNDFLNENIYVFTPNGDVIELPMGSTPIDFAYRVHSDIGDKMVGAIVNDTIVPLNYELKTDDIVKINTNKNSIGPSREWLNMVKTNQARNKIKAFFNKISQEDYLKKGEEILKEELRRKKISIIDFLKEENIKEVLTYFKVENVEQLYIAIGSNKITTSAVLSYQTNGKIPIEESILKKKQNGTVDTPSVKTDIVVSGIDEIKVNVASCCKPLPGEDIVGYITKGNGITVHRSICPNVKDLEERIIAVAWNTEIENKYPCEFFLHTLKKDDVLLSILKIASNNNLSVQNVQLLPNIDYNLLTLTVLVQGREKALKFENDVKTLPEIMDIQRTVQ